MRFENRFQAGIILAEQLKPWASSHPLVLALPRGGVPVAYEIAKALQGELDLLLVKKIGVPGRRELALGAIAEQGKPYWNNEVLSLVDFPKSKLKILSNEKLKELEEQSRILRGDRLRRPVADRVVILVDDGLATGATMIAAIECLKQQKPKKIIVAVPVGSRQAAESISELVDQIVISHIPDDLWSVGLWYQDFTQVSDLEVKELLSVPFGVIPEGEDFEIEIRDDDVSLPGRLTLPPHARGVVVFAHGSGSTHMSPRNRRVAQALHNSGFGTLLFDLLTEQEGARRANVFDIDLLVHRLGVATAWLRERQRLSPLPIGYFGASTGAAAALGAAAKDSSIFAVVSRGGRPDLAKNLPNVNSPTLLIVGGNDGAVITLNESAKRDLKSAEIVIVPGAGHLFEEPGSLEKVMEYAVDWFSRCLDSQTSKAPSHPVEAVIAELRKVAKPIRQMDDLDVLVKRMSEARVVMLGEATHGTEEFYELRKVISQKLIADYGFHFIAVEGDWPDCYELNRYISEPEFALNALEVMNRFKRWPSWMWANHQIEELVEWMKGRRAGFYGLDVYSLNDSLAVLKGYASQVDTKLAEKINAAYSCFEPYEKSEITYASSLIQYPQHCEEEAIECLRELARARLEDTALSERQLFDARQNALILRNAERYYRAMVRGDAESWNIRDDHMMTTLDILLQQHGEGAKGIVWAHNTHIGDYKATDMAEEGYINLGGLARERYGIENVFLLGLGTPQCQDRCRTRIYIPLGAS
jgi:putative phosphoribosyl transferase